MTFDEMHGALAQLNNLLDALQGDRITGSEADRLRSAIMEIQSTLREYSSIHNLMAPRVVRRGYIVAKED